jgi:hypothetical protein
MVKCRKCNKLIDFVFIKDKHIPVQSNFLIENILPSNEGLKYILLNGDKCKGIVVGDSHEGGYIDGYLLHECEVK